MCGAEPAAAGLKQGMGWKIKPGLSKIDATTIMVLEVTWTDWITKQGYYKYLE
jgi:catalase (peroxidase I)